MMKKYVFLGKDLDDFYDFGFYDNIRDEEKAEFDFRENDEENPYYLEAIKTFPVLKVAVTITGSLKGKMIIEAYKYKGATHNHKRIENIDPEPYIQDLIENSLAEEVK